MRPKTKVKAKTPRTPASEAEHQGRVPQPGVPRGPRNADGAPAKTVVTVHDDGSISARGPEAAAATKEATHAVRRVPRFVREIRRAETPKTPPAAPARLLAPLGRYVAQHPEPAVAIQRAKEGTQPPAALRQEHPKTFKKAAALALRKMGEKENLKEDPIAEAVIDTAATAGLGLGAKTLGEVGEAGVAKLLSSTGEKVASTETGTASTLAEKAAQRVLSKARETGSGIRTAPERSLRAVKNAPTRAKELPQDVQDALSSPEARKATAKAAGKTALRHPLRTGVPAVAVLPEGTLPGDAVHRARALLTGLGHAVEHPGEVATSTAHGILGAFSAPIGVVGAAITSAEHGNPAPLEKQLGMYAKGIYQLGANLASGDPKKVEEAFTKEGAAAALIPVPHVLRALKDSDRADELRSSLRDTVEGKRASKREDLVNNERRATEEGAYVSAKNRKKLEKLESVEDSSHPGEKYVLRKTGKFIEKQKARHAVSRLVHRIESSGSNAGKSATKEIIKELRKSKGVGRSEQNFSDALRIFNKYGIPLDESGKSFVRMLHEGYRKNEHGDVPVAGVLMDRHSAKFIIDHPEIFEDEHFRNAVRLFDKASAKVGTSPRNRYLGQVRQILNPLRKAEGKRPILLPEEHVPKETSNLMNVLVKSRDAKKDPWSRDEVLDYAKELKGKEGAELQRHIYNSLTDKEGRPLMRSPEHGGARGGVSTTQAVGWTPEMLKDFVDETRAEAHGRGLREPAPYVADVMSDALKGIEKRPSFKQGLPASKIWPSRGDAAASGNALSDFETNMFRSLEAPHHRAALARGLDQLVAKATRPIDGKKALLVEDFKKAANRHEVPPGTIALRPQALKLLLDNEHDLSPTDFRDALQGQIDETSRIVDGDTEREMKGLEKEVGEREKTGESQEAADIRDELGALKHKGGEKVVPVDGNYVKEFLAHMEPVSGLGSYISKATRYASRAILNSPAFALIQPVQEGVPLAAALARDVIHVPEAIKNVVKASKLDGADQADWKAVVGSSAGFFGIPDSRALRADGYLDPARLAAKPAAWKRAFDLVSGKTLGEFDRARAGWMREVAGDARLQGELRRASKGMFKYGQGAKGLFKDLDKAVADMKGMDAGERHAYIAAHPDLADRFQVEMDNMAGNWNSFTVFEKHIAPLTLFYTFQRYSALWMLYHFPLDHPITATAMTLLGQANAQELQRIAAKQGGEAPGILDYTMPVVQTTGEPVVLPAGKRAFPGLSTIQSAAITGKPSQLLGEVAPEIAAPAEAILGKSSYTGQDIEENGFAFLGKQFAELNPGMRLFLGITNEGSKSAASKAFHAQDPLSAYRSFADPFIAQTAKQYGKTKKLEKDFNAKYGKGNIPNAFDSPLVQELLYGGKNGGPDSSKLPEVLREIHKAEGGSAAVKKDEAPFNGPESEFSPEQTELLEAVENAWETGPSSQESSADANPFSKALSESKTTSTVNPFSKALAESSSGAAKPNPFSAALAKR